MTDKNPLYLTRKEPQTYMAYTLPGIGDRRAPMTAAQAIVAINPKSVPNGFPVHLWNDQFSRYMEYWQWFTGETLSETRASTTEGKPVLKYPLGINPVRNFSRKHASLLLGEETTESALPLIRTVVKPLPSLDGADTADEKTKKLALLAQNCVNEVWADSGGRSAQLENAVLSQFLGGSVFQVAYDPIESADKRIPIRIKAWPVDFFLPIWQGDNYWNLLEAYLVYRIPAVVAVEQYGMKNAVNGTWATYVEHWTRTRYSVYINGQAIVQTHGEIQKLYENANNPFGFVPFVYIPHGSREGNFYGSSMVEDIRGLVREYNSRSADIGDAIRETVHRRRYMRGVGIDPKPKQLAPGTWAINLGVEAAMSKTPPEVYTEDPIELSDSVVQHADTLWTQLLREGNLSDVAFGAEDKAQRTALSIAFRMYPGIAHARSERISWTEGLNIIAKMILTIMSVKSDKIGIEIPRDFKKMLQVSQDWLPFIPVDHETEVNEIILRYTAGLMSLETALKRFGDIPDIVMEIAGIKEMLELQASLKLLVKGPGASGKPVKTEDTVPEEPVAKATQDKF